jgi:hypothetical protein
MLTPQVVVLHCVRVRACLCLCVRACVCACVRACVRCWEGGLQEAAFTAECYFQQQVMRHSIKVLTPALKGTSLFLFDWCRGAHALRQGCSADRAAQAGPHRPLQLGCV